MNVSLSPYTSFRQGSTMQVGRGSSYITITREAMVEFLVSAGFVPPRYEPEMIANPNSILVSYDHADRRFRIEIDFSGGLISEYFVDEQALFAYFSAKRRESTPPPETPRSDVERWLDALGLLG